MKLNLLFPFKITIVFFTNIILMRNPIFLGTHEELMRDPEGAYSQLVRLQAGRKEAESTRTSEAEKIETSFDIDNTAWVNSRSNRSHGSISRGSSGGSRRSFTVRYAIPGAPIAMVETEEAGEDNSQRQEMDLDKRQKVSIKRLAYLNKPEVPALLVGSVGAAIHGLIFPIFGLLLSSAIKMFYEPPSQLRKDSQFWALVYLCLGCITLVAIPVQNYFFGIAGGKLIQRIRSLTFEKVVHQQISWFDDPGNSRYAKTEV